MKRIILGILLIILNIPTAFASPKEDVDYIVDQTVTRTLYEATIKTLRPVLTSAIKNDFREMGITLKNPEKFFDIFVDEFIDEFTEIMRKETGKVYLKIFTEKELSDLATFYKTESGQSLIQKTPVLIAAGSELGKIAGTTAGANARSRVAKKIGEDGMIFNDDKSLTQRLIDALR